MNWAKVKSILIIIFLILNGILGYMNYQKRIENVTLTKQQESNIKKLLYDHNIMVYTLLPQKYLPMRKLLLTPQSIDGEEQIKLLKAIFTESENLNVSTETNELNEKQTIYSKGDKKVGFSTGHITYRADLSSKKPTIHTKEESKKVADEFLTTLGYNLSKLQWNFIDEGNGNYQYKYFETYKGNFIYNSYIEFVIKAEGIEKVDIYKMKPVKYIELSRSIYAPDEMLFGFMNQIRKVQNSKEILVIQRIDLGYLVQSETPWLNEGEATPYYRITLADGRYFYMDAYTNKMQ